MKKVLLIFVALSLTVSLMSQESTYFVGIFADNEGVTEHLTYRQGGDTTLSVWNGWTPLQMGLLTTPFYGDTCLSLLGSDTWLCFGVTSQNALDFGDFYENGVLHLALKIPAEEDDTFRISIKTQDPQNEYTSFFYGSGKDPYGFERNNEWQELKIPFKDLVCRDGWDPCDDYTISQAELAKMRNPFYICAKTNMNVSLDEIWWAQGLEDPGASNVEGNVLRSFSVYPNPADRFLYLRGNNGYDQLEVFDLTGRSIKSFSHKKITMLEVSDMKPGVYIIKATSEGKDFVSKFLKK
jgi:hypothetical protein